MKINLDLHTHTVYSHGKGTIEENAVSAKEKGLYGIAITDHGFSHPAFGMRRKKVAKMRRECDLAEQKTGVKVLLGIESNIRGRDGTIDVKPSDYENLDVVLAGVHKFIFYKTVGDFGKLLLKNMLHDKFKIKASDKLIKYNTECYVNAVKNNPIDVLTHVGFGCVCDAVEVAKACADYGTLFEISTKKTHLTDEEWQKVIETGVNFVVDSDAHSVDRIGDTALACELFKRVNFPIDRIKNIDGQIPTLRFTEFKQKHGIK
ncbi:MAG: PHP domain-containing protein [Clostridia bacterium]|nr:PHP domain-containing protein [Clostridia bacterium]